MVNSYEKSREENRKESKYTVVVGLFSEEGSISIDAGV